MKDKIISVLSGIKKSETYRLNHFTDGSSQEMQMCKESIKLAKETIKEMNSMIEWLNKLEVTA